MQGSNPPLRLYDELAAWWPLLSPPEGYADEAGLYLTLLTQVAGPLKSLLELGAGAGHLATWFPPELEVVLLDRAPRMLDVSRELNPDRQHVCADLRDAKLERTFDAVLLHDAVMYLIEPGDLERALATAAAHLRPGGALLIVPDVVRETFAEGEVLSGAQAPDGRAVRFVEWHWDPDPTDDRYQVEFALLLREADGEVRCVHEQHLMALFSRDGLWSAIVGAGFAPVAAEGVIGAGEVFLARRR